MNNFKFNISLSVLNHLGRNLYRNFITVIGEAISNSWDADATNVWITIDKNNNCLIIQDDGEGMSEEDFQSKFLKIGYSKRKDGVNKTKKGRPFIGRKGIGKLALISCAEKVLIITKTKNSALTGGVIDNTGLDIAIKDDINSEDYKLENLENSEITKYSNTLTNGTVIKFENIKDGIKNNIDYIGKLIALYFRFSLYDNSFKIHLDNKEITLDELNDLALSTQFVWTINNFNDLFLTEKNSVSNSNSNIKKNEHIKSNLTINGFIATVGKPSDLKIKNTDEKVSVDLYVNGRLREKDLLRHIPSSRIVENYLYGQIHFDKLDQEKDLFTTSREGVISDDPDFQSLLKELKKILTEIIDQWDKWRIEINQDGDVENTKRLSKKERKSKELYNEVANDFIPKTNSKNSIIVKEWANSLTENAAFNLTSYTECFVSENLLRIYIKHKNLSLTDEDKNEAANYRNSENEAKRKANISYDIRKYTDDLQYLSMEDLSNFVDKPKSQSSEQAVSRDVKIYKLIRNAIAHTSIITEEAKKTLNITYENIKARIKKILE